MGKKRHFSVIRFVFFVFNAFLAELFSFILCCRSRLLFAPQVKWKICIGQKRDYRFYIREGQKKDKFRVLNLPHDLRVGQKKDDKKLKSLFFGMFRHVGRKEAKTWGEQKTCVFVGRKKDNVGHFKARTYIYIYNWKIFAFNRKPIWSPSQNNQQFKQNITCTM